MKRVKVLTMAVVLMFSMLTTGFLTMGVAEAKPNFLLPFACNEKWVVKSWSGHNPYYAVDMNKYGTSGNGDYGENVVASAPGTVKSVVNLGDRSYGLYIIIDHGGGWETLYAHLNSANVSQGQSVQAGDGIGKVGNSGTTYAHLHYEQRYQGDDRPVTLQGYTFSYPSDSRTMTSQNCGGSNEITGTVHTDNGLPVNVRSGPGTSYSIVGKKYDGDVVTIECQIRGETVTGKYGTSDLWDRIGPGQYISDTYVYTGSDGQVAPTCPSP